MLRRLLKGGQNKSLFSTLKVGGQSYPTDEWTNLPPSIVEMVGRDLHRKPNHPIGIISDIIEKRLAGLGFTCYSQFPPVVSKYENFDALGFPEDHPGRSKTDTYYINRDTLLRTHTSAHELQCFQTCPTPGYLISADVYRRDTIDRTHYPVFHQMEGARTWKRGPNLIRTLKDDLVSLPESNVIVEDPNPPFQSSNPKQDVQSAEECELLGKHLKRTVELLMNDLFMRAKRAAVAAGSTDPDLDQPLKARWVEAYFPWTGPSWEIEIWWKGDWLEMCGCGIVQHHLYQRAGLEDCVGWAFGIGLERSAMILFGIPDIRLFWSNDPKFLEQFQEDEVTMFQPWSRFPSTHRDVAFWLPQGDLHENDVMEVVRAEGGDLVESVALLDDFVHPKTKRRSWCFRICYQSMERTLTNDEINAIQGKVITALENKGVEIR